MPSRTSKALRRSVLEYRDSKSFYSEPWPHDVWAKWGQDLMSPWRWNSGQTQPRLSTLHLWVPRSVTQPQPGRWWLSLFIVQGSEFTAPSKSLWRSRQVFCFFHPPKKIQCKLIYLVNWCLTLMVTFSWSYERNFEQAKEGTQEVDNANSVKKKSLWCFLGMDSRTQGDLRQSFNLTKCCMM